MRGCARGLVEPHVRVARGIAPRRQLGGSAVSIKGRDVSVSLVRITIVRQRVRQRRGRAGGPDENSQSGGKQTPIAQATHRGQAILALRQPQPSR